MEGIVLRVRLISGDTMDVTYEGPHAGSEEGLVDHVVSTLATDNGVLRCRHGDRLLVLYARGVAAVEVAPGAPSSEPGSSAGVVPSSIVERTRDLRQLRIPCVTRPGARRTPQDIAAGRSACGRARDRASGPKGTCG